MGILGRDHRAAKAEACVAGRHDQVHREHVYEGAKLDHPLRERDRGEDQRGADERRDLGGNQRRDPGTGIDLAGVDREQVHDEDRQACVDRELAHVEHELHRRQAPVEQQDQAATEQTSEDERLGAAEDHPEHQRDVAEREGMGAATEVQMDNAPLGDGERHRDRPPRQVRMGQRLEAVNRPDVEHRGRDDQRDIQPPHRMDPAGTPEHPHQASRRFGLGFGSGLRGHPSSADVVSRRRALCLSIGAHRKKVEPPGLMRDGAL